MRGFWKLFHLISKEKWTSCQTKHEKHFILTSHNWTFPEKYFTSELFSKHFNIVDMVWHSKRLIDDPTSNSNLFSWNVIQIYKQKQVRGFENIETPLFMWILHSSFRQQQFFSRSVMCDWTLDLTNLKLLLSGDPIKTKWSTTASEGTQFKFTIQVKTSAKFKYYSDLSKSK